MNEGIVSNIAYYVRVSTKDKQDFQYQIDALDRYVEQQGLNKDNCKVEIYKEKESGYNDERLELKKLLEEIQNGIKKYSCVYITEISRLGRSSKKVREALEVFKESKTNLYIKQLNVYLLNEDGKTNDFGNIVLSIFIELSDAEARQFKERSKDGIRSSIMSGNASGGQFLPYGFKKDNNKKLLIDDEEAEVVRLIFDLYKAGYGTKVIAGILNNRQIPTRSKRSFGEKEINSKTGKTGNNVIWKDKTVDDILKNSIYIGKRRYWGGKENHKNPPELFEMSGETLLNPTTIFHECMEIRQTKTHRNFLTEYTYLLKDKMICGKCGRNYFAKYKPTPNGDKVYICSGRLIKGGNCGNVGVNISLIESAIFNEIVATDSILKHINNKDAIRKRLEDDLFLLENQIKLYERKAVTLDGEISATINLQVSAKANNNETLLHRYTTKLDDCLIENENNEKQLKKARMALVKTSNALIQRSSIETTTKELKSYTNDRTRLRGVFLQIIDKVIITVIDKDTILADVFISIDGIVLPSSMKMFLDISGMRLRKKSYRYRALVDLGFDLDYSNGILQTNIEKLQEAVYLFKESDGLVPRFDVINIPDKWVLTIPIKNS